MKPTKFLAGAVVTAIGGLAMTSIASATAPVTVESNGDLTVCGIEYVSDENGAYGCITIQGKNVGATTTGTGRNAQDTSFGNYYNRGVNTPYLPGQAAIFNPDNNAWGGGGDYNGDFFYQVYPVLNPIDRKGPCDTGYHVPSEGEWNALMDMYVGSEGGVYGSLDYEYYYSFVNDFQIPYAGYYYNDGEYLNDTSALWFSSPSYDDSAQAFRFYYSESYGQITQFDHDSALPVRCFKNPSVSSPSVSYVELTDPNTQVTVGQTEYNELPSTMTVTTNNEVNVEEDKPVVGEVSVSFGSNESAKFSKLVKVNVPVDSAEQVIIKVKHAGSDEYNFDGLTTNVNASCNNGRPTSNQYNGETITVVDGFASIYTCEASDFVALGVENGGDPLITVNIAEFNGGQNTCTGSDFIFESISADKVAHNYELTGLFECAFGDSQSKTVTLQLSGNLVADGDRVISGSNVQMKNSEWTSSPVGLKFANTMISTYQALTTTKTLFQKTGSMIGIASGVVSVQITVPAGTPDGTYNGTLVLTY